MDLSKNLGKLGYPSIYLPRFCLRPSLVCGELLCLVVVVPLLRARGPRFVDLAGAAAISASGAVRTALAAPVECFRTGRGASSGVIEKSSSSRGSHSSSRFLDCATYQRHVAVLAVMLEGSLDPCSRLQKSRCSSSSSSAANSERRQVRARLHVRHSYALLDPVYTLNSSSNDAALRGTNRRLRRPPGKCGGPCLPCQGAARLRRAARARSR